jgi:putative thioredoxin
MSNIKDINQDQFVQEVVEVSKTTPVIVDFWAPWCGPCKQLTPTLENLVNKKGGKVVLAKINVDENQGIAAQLNIQSIPTVYGFVDGKPIDAFQGAQPESKIEAMINKLIDAMPGNEIPALIQEAEKLFKEQEYEKAQKIYENLIGLDPGNTKIISGLLRCLTQLRKFDDAKELLESLDDETLNNPEINKVKKLIESLNNNVNESIIDNLSNQIKQNPNDKNLRLKLSMELLQSNQIEKGFDELLILFDQDPKWNDEVAKKKLLEYFDMLGFNDPNVIEARKQLSRIMFK